MGASISDRLPAHRAVAGITSRLRGHRSGAQTQARGLSAENRLIPGPLAGRIGCVPDRLPVVPLPTINLINQLMKQLAHLFLGQIEGFAAFRSCPVDFPTRSAVLHFRGPEVSAIFEAMQQRIQGSRADAVAMTLEFLHHTQAEDWLLHSMM
jgi:hypothetical protein